MINKWTVGLATAGLVSLASVQAEERVTPLLTALSSTTISGYVDVSAQWNPGTGTTAPGFAFAGPNKRDGFNLNSVLVSLEKPLDEAEWSAGYKLDLMWGPDVNQITRDASPSDAIRQAYVALRAPVGNGLDLKLGVWDTLLGYESIDSYKNPNFTRSYGFTITEQQHTGALASYQVSDLLSVNAGVANILNNAGINSRSPRAESHKMYTGSIALTAPDALGFLAGSALYAGIADGFGSAGEDQTSVYVGATIATPVEGLRLGAAWDFVDDPWVGGGDTYAVAVYASFLATDKLGLHLRGEYANGSALANYAPPGTASPSELIAVTATLQYSLWDNVLSRLEARWDHATDASDPYANGRTNDYLIAANLVYKF